MLITLIFFDLHDGVEKCSYLLHLIFQLIIQQNNEISLVSTKQVDTNSYAFK